MKQAGQRFAARHGPWDSWTEVKICHGLGNFQRAASVKKWIKLPLRLKLEPKGKILPLEKGFWRKSDSFMQLI